MFIGYHAPANAKAGYRDALKSVCGYARRPNKGIRFYYLAVRQEYFAVNKVVNMQVKLYLNTKPGKYFIGFLVRFRAHGAKQFRATVDYIYSTRLVNQFRVIFGEDILLHFS